jgi:hypothetical protein
MPQPPLLLGLVSDLFFTVQIENAAKALGYRVQWIESGESLEPGLTALDPRRTAEPLAGRGSVFIRRVVEWQPALIVADMSSTAIPWADWIAALKSSPAARRIPVIAFGPHTNLALLGCDAVVAKSRLVSALPELITQYARLTDHETLAHSCQGSLSPLAQKGVDLFDRREFFEAHEELEHAWNEPRGGCGPAPRRCAGGARRGGTPRARATRGV